jgi:hypothetical protein
MPWSIAPTNEFMDAWIPEGEIPHWPGDLARSPGRMGLAVGSFSETYPVPLDVSAIDITPGIIAVQVG